MQCGGQKEVAEEALQPPAALKIYEQEYTSSQSSHPPKQKDDLSIPIVSIKQYLLEDNMD